MWTSPGAVRTCASEGAVSRGMDGRAGSFRTATMIHRMGSGRTFNCAEAVRRCPRACSHKERWLSFGASLAKGPDGEAASARAATWRGRESRRCFRWRRTGFAGGGAHRRPASDSEVAQAGWRGRRTRPIVPESRKRRAGLGSLKARKPAEGGQGGELDSQRGALEARAGPAGLDKAHGGSGPERDEGHAALSCPGIDAAALTAAMISLRSAFDPVVAKDALLVSERLGGRATATGAAPPRSG